MKKFLLSIILIGMIFIISACNSGDEPDKTDTAAEKLESAGQAGTEPQKKLYVVNNVKEKTNEAPAAQQTSMETSLGIGINLGNTFESYWEDKNNSTTGAQTIGADTPADYETCWGAVMTTKEIIDGMKAAGFSTVRIPVYWGNMMKDDGTFTINEQYFGRVAKIIDYCHDNDMYVIINIHHYDEFLIKNYPQDRVLDITRSLWTQIANRYKDYEEFLIFEGFNENLGTTREQDNYSEDEIYRYVNAMNQTFVDAVRAAGENNKTRMLIVSGYWTNIDKTTDPRFVMPSDVVSGRLMVSLHYVDNIYYWMNQIGGKAWFDYAKEQCELLRKKFTDNNIPVVIGECTGVYEDSHFAADAIYRDKAVCLEMILELLSDYGFVPVIWDDGNRFYDRNTCKINDADTQAVIRRIADKISK